MTKRFKVTYEVDVTGSWIDSSMVNAAGERTKYVATSKGVVGLTGLYAPHDAVIEEVPSPIQVGDTDIEAKGFDGGVVVAGPFRRVIGHNYGKDTGPYFLVDFPGLSTARSVYESEFRRG